MPDYLIINGINNSVSKRIPMQQSGENVLQYKQSENVILNAGEYEFYFEYSDGSILAPYTTSAISLDKTYKKYGNYVTTPAKDANIAT